MIWLLALAPVIDGMRSHTPQRAAEKSELVAQIVSDEIHQRCLAASDYSGCIRSNSDEPTSRAKQFNETDQEKCWDNGVCIAKSGQDQLGMNKVVGWNYSYNPSDNTVLYWNLPAKGSSQGSTGSLYCRQFYRTLLPATDSSEARLLPRINTSKNRMQTHLRWRHVGEWQMATESIWTNLHNLRSNKNLGCRNPWRTRRPSKTLVGQSDGLRRHDACQLHQWPIERKLVKSNEKQSSLLQQQK